MKLKNRGYSIDYNYPRYFTGIVKWERTYYVRFDRYNCAWAIGATPDDTFHTVYSLDNAERFVKNGDWREIKPEEAVLIAGVL